MTFWESVSADVRRPPRGPQRTHPAWLRVPRATGSTSGASSSGSSSAPQHISSVPMGTQMTSTSSATTNAPIRAIPAAARMSRKRPPDHSVAAAGEPPKSCRRIDDQRPTFQSTSTTSSSMHGPIQTIPTTAMMRRDPIHVPESHGGGGDEGEKIHLHDNPYIFPAENRFRRRPHRHYAPPDSDQTRGRLLPQGFHLDQRRQVVHRARPSRLDFSHIRTCAPPEQHRAEPRHTVQDLSDGVMSGVQRVRTRRTRRGRRGRRKEKLRVQNNTITRSLHVHFAETTSTIMYAPRDAVVAIRKATRASRPLRVDRHHANKAPAKERGPAKARTPRCTKREVFDDKPSGAGSVSGDTGISPRSLGRRDRGTARHTDANTEGRDARLAPLPPQLRLHVLARWDAALVHALSTLPRLRPRALFPARRPDYTDLDLLRQPHLQRMLRRMRPEDALETASLFTRYKAKRHQLRLIIDSRNANERLYTTSLLGPRMPNVSDVSRFLSASRWAATSDFANFFYAFPISRQLQRLFYVPRLRSAVTRLPMGWSRAPDLASAGSAAIAGASRDLVVPSRRRVSSLICVDNILVGGPSSASVRRRVDWIDKRVQRVNATYSEPFGDPTKNVHFYGIDWNLQTRLRGLPLPAAQRAKRELIAFARSRGPQRLDRWRRIVGLASWVGIVTNIDASRRLRLIQTLRIAQSRGRLGVIPDRVARRECRRHADAALTHARIDAPADRRPNLGNPYILSRERPWLISDAASPGSIAVLFYRDSTSRPSLVHWERTPRGMDAVRAECIGLAAAARFVTERRLHRPILATDARTVFDIVRRGICRNRRHNLDIRAIRRLRDSHATLVWLPTGMNPADGPSREYTLRAAFNSTPRWGPLVERDKWAPKPLSFTL